MHSINVEEESLHMVDKNKTKTKAEMLLELESIKGLLHEEDDIPILQETASLREPIAVEKVSPIVKPVASHSVASAPVKAPDLKSRADEQPDLFHKPATTDSATQLLNTLNDFAALAETVTTHKVAGQSATNPGAVNQRAAHQSAANQSIANQQTATNSAVDKARAAIARAETTKFSGENPFLPQHIRTRLHGNNPPPNFEFETAKKISNSSRPTTQLGNTQQNYLTAKPVSHQQEMIDDIIEAMLPQITKTLRDRLAGMSKEMLEILLEENDRF
ncbi:MAG: hypothetical protein V4732_20535 [Pseudomonadota bacterium]